MALAPAPKCIECDFYPQSSPKRGKTKTCKNCRAWNHGAYNKTLKQIFKSAIALQIKQRRMRTVAEVNYETGEVERVDKQHLVDAGIVCFAGIKPRGPSKAQQLKTRAAGNIAQIKVRERRRRAASASSRQQHAHAHA
jgi:hypothetical protein